MIIFLLHVFGPVFAVGLCWFIGVIVLKLN